MPAELGARGFHAMESLLGDTGYTCTHANTNSDNVREYLGHAERCGLLASTSIGTSSTWVLTELGKGSFQTFNTLNREQCVMLSSP